jgi:integrase
MGCKSMAKRKKTDFVQFKVRFREALRRRLEGAAKAQERSLNSEIVARLEESFTRDATLATFTGLRRGEILALRWRNVDLDRKVLQVREALEQTKAHGIRFKAPKSKAGRRDVTMPDIVVAVLRQHRIKQLELRAKLGLGRLADDDLLFAGLNGGPIGPKHFSANIWIDYAASIRMPEITFHSLRHTHASQLIAAGVDVVTISKRLGHSNPAITLRTYAHLFANDDRKATAAINEAVAKW